MGFIHLRIWLLPKFSYFGGIQNLSKTKLKLLNLQTTLFRFIIRVSQDNLAQKGDYQEPWSY